MSAEKNKSPFSNSPVMPCDRFPRWLRRGNRLPDYFWEWPHATRLFDHHGQTIIGDRLALTSEPYARGCVDVLDLASNLADKTGAELRVCLPTWHGYGTMRFSWLAPRTVRPPKYLARFVADHTRAVEVVRKLARALPDPAACDRATLIAEFWKPFWLQVELRSADAHNIRPEVQAFLAWRGYGDVRRMREHSTL